MDTFAHPSRPKMVDFICFGPTRATSFFAHFKQPKRVNFGCFRSPQQPPPPPVPVTGIAGTCRNILPERCDSVRLNVFQ